MGNPKKSSSNFGGFISDKRKPEKTDLWTRPRKRIMNTSANGFAIEKIGCSIIL